MTGRHCPEDDLRTITVDPCSDPRWADLARRHGGLFESPPWLASIRDAYGIVPEAQLALDRAGRPVAGLTAGLVDDGLGRRRSSFPFSDYTDPIGPSVDVVLERLLTRNVDASEPYAVRSRRTDLSEVHPHLVERGLDALHQVDLDPGIDALWERLAAKARQNVRRSGAAGLTIEESADRQALARFHRMHIELRRHKYRMLAQPIDYFDALHQHLASNLTVLTARHDGTAIAAFVLLRCGDTAYYKLGSSTPGASAVRATDALMWHSICFARTEWGCSTLDLGLSDLAQPGLIRFKAKYATTASKVVSYRTPTEGAPQEHQLRATINALTDALIDPGVPHEVLQRASSELYRYFC